MLQQKPMLNEPKKYHAFMYEIENILQLSMDITTYAKRANKKTKSQRMERKTCRKRSSTKTRGGRSKARQDHLLQLTKAPITAA
jgi:hypothetical protein